MGWRDAQGAQGPKEGSVTFSDAFHQRYSHWFRDAIRKWLATDETIARSQLVGKSWCMTDPKAVDDLVVFLERVVRGVNAILEGGLPSAARDEAAQGLAVPEVREEVQQSHPSVRGAVREEQGSRQACGNEACRCSRCVSLERKLATDERI